MFSSRTQCSKYDRVNTCRSLALNSCALYGIIITFQPALQWVTSIVAKSMYMLYSTMYIDLGNTAHLYFLYMVELVVKLVIGRF
jgi:hypothetical protein